jgi:hypothetical protein
LILLSRSGCTVAQPEKSAILAFSRIFSICESRKAAAGATIAHSGMKTDRAKKPSKKQKAILSCRGPAIFNCKGPDAFAMAPDACLTGIGFADMADIVRIALYLPLCARSRKLSANQWSVVREQGSGISCQLSEKVFIRSTGAKAPFHLPSVLRLD